MKDRMKVLYLYNSGVLLSFGEESILFDGVYNDNNIFDKMPPGYKETLINKEIPFSSVKALLFTHCHDDHYDEDTVKMFLYRHKDSEVVAPIAGSDGMLTGDSGKLTIGVFEIEYLKTRHIFVGPLSCDNYVYKVKAGGQSIVLTGDTDPESLGRIIDVFGFDVDVFLINAATFLCEMKRPEKTFLRQVKNLYVYHLPTESNDNYSYRKATVSAINKASSHLGNVNYLLDNLKYI